MVGRKEGSAVNITERLEQTWQQTARESLAFRELTMLVLIQNEKIRILSRTQSLTTKDALAALDMALGQFLMSKEGGE